MILVCIGGIFIFAYLFFDPRVINGKKYFVLMAGGLLFLYAALRAQDLHIDIPSYIESYEKYSKYSYQEICSLFNKENFKDPTYYFVGWLFSHIFSNPQWWLAFVAACYLIPVAIIIYKESQNPLISFFAFLALGFFEFSLSGLRQTLAMSFTILSYFGIKNRKPVLFVIMVLIASLFHQTALLFLVVYPIARLKLGIGHLMVFIVALVLFVGYQEPIKNFLRDYLSDTQYSYYPEQGITLNLSGFVIQAAIFIFCLIYYPTTSKKYEQSRILYNLSFMGVVFQLFASMIAELFRISMYFSFFNILLVTMVITAEPSKKMRALETIGVCLACISYMLLTGIPRYAFFWG